MSDIVDSLNHSGRVLHEQPFEAQTAYAAAAEITRLRAIVDKLPKTADGVPITPNMNLYSPCEDYDFGCIAFRYEPDDFEIACRDVRGVEFELRAEQCYSTREAAEEAMRRAASGHPI